MRRIVVLSTGGTIATRRGHGEGNANLWIARRPPGSSRCSAASATPGRLGSCGGEDSPCDMTIHPDVSGRPQTLLMLERLIEYLSGHDRVRWTTFDEIARDLKARHPRS
jgi:hypothetical protein